MKPQIVFLVCLLLIFVEGCGKAQKKPNAQATITAGANSIRLNTAAIIANDSKIRDTTKEPDTKALAVDTVFKAQSIEEGVGTIETGSEEYVIQIDQLEQDKEKLQKDLAKIQDELKSWTYHIYSLMIIGCLIGLALSVAAYIWVSQSKVILMIAAFCLLLLGLTIFVQKYEKPLMYGSVAVFVMVGGYMLWQWIQNKKGFTEVVNFMDDTVKPALPVDVKNKIFDNVTTEMQSPATQKLVAAIRGK
jgi:hypothetical protein